MPSGKYRNRIWVGVSSPSTSGIETKPSPNNFPFSPLRWPEIPCLLTMSLVFKNVFLFLQLINKNVCWCLHMMSDPPFFYFVSIISFLSNSIKFDTEFYFKGAKIEIRFKSVYNIWRKVQLRIQYLKEALRWGKLVCVWRNW